MSVEKIARHDQIAQELWVCADCGPCQANTPCGCCDDARRPTVELDLTEAIEAAEAELRDRITNDISDAETRREVAEAAVRAAAPIIERAVLKQILVEAAKCRQCGKAHELRERESSQQWLGQTWADPVDGHTYMRTAHGPIEDWIREYITAREADGG